MVILRKFHIGVKGVFIVITLPVDTHVTVGKMESLDLRLISPVENLDPSVIQREVFNEKK
jgi:hypothetical protein